MDEQIKAIERNQTWELVDLPTNKTLVGVKWLYKTKINEKCMFEKFKERLVSKGFVLQPDIDYGETFFLVVMIYIARIVLAIATKNKWHVHQMNVKLAFCNGILEEVYVNKHPGYEIHGKEHKMSKLKNYLYGLKHAPRAWYNHINSYLLNNAGFSQATMNPYYT